ncbi:hypothetical protein JCM11641_005847 [Rhodosporidiobolus odoratus]
MADSTDWIELTAHYNGVYVFLSYLVAVVGAWTTLEMLLKRTGSSGTWNVMLLLAAGSAFGSTATFGMHFVGNQAVTLRFPAPSEERGIPLSYDAGYTVLSLVVSCLSMILAFSFIGLRLNAPPWRARISDEEEGSLRSSEQAFEARLPEMRRNDSSCDQKSPEIATGGAFDPDVKVDPSHHQTRFTLPTGHRLSLPGASLSPSKVGASPGKEKGRFEDDDDDEDDEDTADGGDFGVHAASVSRWGIAKVLIAGVICGGGIAAMHYVGQVSISSVPRVTNSWYTVFLSVIIAMACVSAGLYILFVIFRPKLQHSWYKRILVAMILAIGVTVMHFVALLGTHYWARRGESLEAGSDNGTKRAIIAIICVVAPFCCIALLIFAFIGQQRLLRQRLSRHQIILSTAIFDQQGLLLVQPESGLLPSAKIYPSQNKEAEHLGLAQLFGFGKNRLSLRTSKLKLARSDPAFIAFLKSSWAWRSRRTAIANGDTPDSAGEQASSYGAAANKEEEHEVGGTRDPRMSEGELTGSEAEMVKRSILSFEMASEEIASQITGTTDLKALGIMHDNILKIGHFQVSSKSSGDKFTVTQGQMLVLARRLKNSAEREALVARGFVFADPSAVARVTSNAYAVPNERVFDYFRDVYRFTRFGVVKRLDRGRLYGGLLLLQALPGDGLHVVVDSRQHHCLPMVELGSLVAPSADCAHFASYPHFLSTIEGAISAVQQLGGQSLLDLINTSSAPSDPASDLRNAIVNQLRPHLERVLSSENLSVLLSRIRVSPQLVPLTARHGPLYSKDGLIKDSYFICVKAVIPSSVALPGPRLNWLPFALHQAQSECVGKASGSNASASASSRPNTAKSAVDSAKFAGAWSGSSQTSGERTGSGSQDHFESVDLPFSTVTSAPFVSSAFPSAPSSSNPPRPLSSVPMGGSVGPSGQRGSTYSVSSNTEKDEEEDVDLRSPASARSLAGQQAVDLPAGVPVYSQDWVIDLVRETIRQPGQDMWRWDVPHKPGGNPRKSGQ